MTVFNMRLSLGAACTRRKDTRDRDDRRPSAMNQLVREQRRNSIHPSPSNSDNRPSGGVHRPLYYTTTSSQADRGKNRQKDECTDRGMDRQAGGRKDGSTSRRKDGKAGQRRRSRRLSPLFSGAQWQAIGPAERI